MMQQPLFWYAGNIVRESHTFFCLDLSREIYKASYVKQSGST